MNRRSLLAGVASLGTAGVAGCVGTIPANVTGGGGTATPRVTIGDVSDVAYDMAVEVAKVEGFTEDSPAKIRLLLRNDGDSVRNIFSGLLVFSSPIARHVTADDELILAGDEVTHPVDLGPDYQKTPEIPDNPTNGCWGAPDRGVIGDAGWDFELQPGQAVGGIRALLNSPRGSECLRRGTYRYDPDPISVDSEEIDPSFTIELTDDTEEA